jgi:segregation and condensation protein B
MIEQNKSQKIIEAALLVAGTPLTVSALGQLFPEEERPAAADIKAILAQLQAHYQDRGIELKETGSGWRIQAKAELSPWLAKLWAERAPRYSRAFLETLAIIAYRQPITRAEIEDIRGVAVNSQIIKTLFEREWVQVVGYRDLPGRPALLGTTKAFLDYFNIKSLTELPELSAIKPIEAEELVDSNIEAVCQVPLALEEHGEPL